MSVVLAFDLGLSLGWAKVRHGAPERSGTFVMPGGHHPGTRYLALARWLNAEASLLLEPECVVGYEAVRSHTQRDRQSGKSWFAVDGSHVYGAIQGILLAWAAAKKAPIRPVEIGKWKTDLGCRGGSQAKKEEIARCMTLLRFPFKSQDECDAIGIGLSLERALRLESMMPAGVQLSMRPALTKAVGAARRRAAKGNKGV